MAVSKASVRGVSLAQASSIVDQARAAAREKKLRPMTIAVTLVYLVFLMTLERHEGRGNILRARTRANYNPPYFSLPYFSLA